MPIVQFLTCGAAVTVFEDLSIINQTQENCCNHSSRFPCVLLGINSKEKKRIWHNKRSYFKILRKRKKPTYKSQTIRRRKNQIHKGGSSRSEPSAA